MPSVLLDVIEAQEVTDTFIVPALLGAILMDPTLGSWDLSRLRHVL